MDSYETCVKCGKLKKSLIEIKVRLKHIVRKDGKASFKTLCICKKCKALADKKE